VLAELDQALLGKVRVDLDLVNLGSILGIAEDVGEESTGDVGDTNVLCEASVDELLHCAPCLAVGNTTDGVALFIGAEPAGREPLRNRNVFEGAGEVHEKEIKVINAPETQLVFSNLEKLFDARISTW
jgi:hypothetical protein